ncbi:thioredoxin family protein [Paenibacillus guangzhouensis]|uniref:thioredoxin family protein n=1 Tax=Paenibacillus guangzhouensis TaxID=1473112 RepID=UPI0012675D92|nr:thioredoxin family protein [Paenibacillus guangzhouensis]
MSKNVAAKLRTGITPKQFIDGMTKNQDTFKGWYDAFTWQNAEDEEFYESLNNRDDLRCLIIAADWCGDVVRNIPVVFRLMEKAGIPTEVFIMEEHLDFMDQFLTRGGRSVPVVIIGDTGGYVLAQWGPRPAAVQAHMNAFKLENPDREASDYQEKIQIVRQKMIQEYGEGTGYQAVITAELRDLLAGV